MDKLAVIIPAYKSKYFERVLNSLASQTNKNFIVYVGDDCSQEKIEQICIDFKNRLNIKYHRFDKNLGGKDLVAQWNRCCALIADEEWIWLFSDDDVAESTCVERFYDVLLKTNKFYDVYRFDTMTIDQNDNVVNVSPENPEIEDHYSLTYHLLMGERGNSMPDHIFRMSRFKSLGGFINFPFAQASDFASSIKFANPKGLYTIHGPKVKWRFSGDNISSLAYKIRNKAIFGYLSYIRWLDKELNISELQKQKIYNHNLTKELLLENLTQTIITHYKGVPYSKFFRVVKEISEIFDWNYIKAFSYCSNINWDVHVRKKAWPFKIRAKLKSIVTFRNIKA